MVAPYVVGTATTSASVVSGGTIVLDKPSGVQDGDVLVAVLRTNGSTSPTDFALSGWTRRGYTFVANDAAGRVTGIFTHPVTSAVSEPSTYTFTKSVSDARRVGVMFIVRGVDLTNPVAGNSTGWDATPSPRIQLNSFTVDTVDAALLLYAWGNEIVSPNPTEPTIPPGTAIALVPSSSGTGSTRTTVWAGWESNSATSTGHKNLTWAVSTGGPAATGVVLRGLSGFTGTASGSLSLAGSGTTSIGVAGSGSGGLTVAGSGSPTTGVARVATGTLTTSGSGSPAVGFARGASVVLPVSGTGSVTVAYAQVAAGTVALAGAASSLVGVAVVGGGQLSVTLTATVTIGVTRDATVELTLAGVGNLAVQLPDVRTLEVIEVTHTLTPLSVTRTLEDA